ncbi:MAG: MltA domain-containing protein [Acetobacterales bacterium]
MRTTIRLIVAAILAGAAACAPETPTETPTSLKLAPAAFDDLRGWEAGGQAGAVLALQRTCRRFATLPSARQVGPDGMAGTVADWAPACAAADAVPAGDDAAARRYFETWFAPFSATAEGQAEGLFTGYYEPLLHGTLRRDARHTVPVYRRPEELVLVDLGRFRESLRGERIAGKVVDGRLQPYATRAEIDAGALRGRGLELAWVEDPVAVFFLHIQGSGQIALEEGGRLRVSYDGHNGHPYVAIGRTLVAQGALDKDDVSLQTIRAWLRANPEEGRSVMAGNPSFIFFRKLEGDGPVGALGVPLTPGHSLAVDRTFMPLGAPVWLDANDPLDPQVRLRRLMVAQDTGGAIRGPVRGDVFWGAGDDAEERAGRMKSSGRYWLLLPKAVAERRMAARPDRETLRLGGLSLRF